MATFEVKIYKLTIENHPNADALELARIGDYRCVVPKNKFVTGDYGVYIPEGTILPDWLISKLGLEGKLAGKQKNRIKAIKLRGIVSQGLIYEVNSNTKDSDKVIVENQNGPITVNINDNLSDILELKKYEPPIPVHMMGEVFNAFGYTLSYDIENLKKYPNILDDVDLISITEKIHGTWACIGYSDERIIISSKGLSAKGLAFKINEANKNNLYVQTLFYNDNGYKIDQLKQIFGEQYSHAYLVGEIFGQGVQDLQYGSQKPQFRLFDIYVGLPGHGRFLNFYEFLHIANRLEIPTVPILYDGVNDKQKIIELTDGKETVSGNKSNIREGIVIKPLFETHKDEIGRVIVKSVSDDYLFRKGDTTEYN